MSCKIANKCLIIMGIIFILGLILTISSVNIGRNVALDELTKTGGMTTEEYRLVIKSYIDAFRTCGLVVSLFGGLGTLLSAYTCCNTTE